MRWAATAFSFAAAAALSLVLQSEARGWGADMHMPTGEPVAPPGGFVLYCLNFPGECLAKTETPALLPLDGSLEELLASVQDQVNEAVRPQDPSLPHNWHYPIAGTGDCNSYALEKKKELVAAGLPRSALLLAAAYTERHEGHLVLVVRTNVSDLVLDNRVPHVVDWTALPYQWVSRQSATDSAMWVAILAPDAVSAADAASLPAAYEACDAPSLIR